METTTKLVIAYLASPREWRHLHWRRIECLAASLEQVSRFLPIFPVHVFHEDYTKDDQERLLDRNHRITFEKVDFTGKESLHVSTRPGERVGSYGYNMMCHFLSGPMQERLSVAYPLCTHYMRLDDDSYIISPIQEAVVNRFFETDYTHRDNYHDPHESLYAHTEEFLRGHGFRMTAPYHSSVPYNNFHVASFRLWKAPLVQKFIESIEQVNGCLQHGWHDTPIQAMILRQLIPLMPGFSSRVEPEFAYRHNQQCCHEGHHTELCYDGITPRDQPQWGPPKLF